MLQPTPGYQQIFAAMAKFFNMELDVPMALKHPLPKLMAAHEATWNAIVERHGLKKIAYKDLATWEFMEWVRSLPPGLIRSLHVPASLCILDAQRRTKYHKYAQQRTFFLPFSPVSLVSPFLNQTSNKSGFETRLYLSH